jgi:hypothetical protein
MESKFQYRPLDISADEFRLLEILPSIDVTATVQCKLIHKPLSSPPHYIALSYTWDDPLGKKEDPISATIELEGETALIGKNLESALRYMRVKQISSVWIDAICINQKDLPERGAQVLRMHQIYVRAERVLVWLGPAADESDLGLKLLRILAEKRREAHANTWLREVLQERRYSSEWKAFAQLLNRGWWSRAWVVQETVLANNIEFACGEQSVPGRDLLEGTRFLMFVWNDTGALLHRLEDIVLNTNSLDCIAGQRLLMDRKNEGTQTGIIQCLSITSQTRATDPRDALYSKLGLAHDSATMVPAPNYHVSTKDTFTDFVKSYIEVQRDLEILCVDKQRVVEDLPSWVPDWSGTASTFSFQPSLSGGDMRLTDYCASRASKALVRFLNYDLIARGACIDTIDGVGFCNWLEDDDLRKLQQSKGSNCIYTSGVEAFSAIWRSMVAGWCWLEGQYSEAPEEFGCELAQICQEEEEKLRLNLVSTDEVVVRYELSTMKYGIWYQAIREMRFGGKTIRERLVAARLKSSGSSNLDENGKEAEISARSAFDQSRSVMDIRRRMITSDKGYFGLAPALTQPGDKICVLLGCSRPVIIRKHSGSYEFIGPAYIHGIMHGEVMSASEDRPSFQDFCIR